ncbi:MAG: serine O-acetyltransferase [Noviherbaspirillum sp.]
MGQTLQNLLLAALCDSCEPQIVTTVTSHPGFTDLIAIIELDLMALKAKDPAAPANPNLIALGYTSFKAVLHYRLAHWIAKTFSMEFDHRSEEIAMIISSRGKLQSGAEIHHRCEIGRRFVMDHGYGTVIGETTSIGDDCYILSGVILGAKGIACNPGGKRHPTIGHRVQIGAFASVLGPVSIGNDVYIGAHTQVSESIPDHSVITMKSRIQVLKAGIRHQFPVHPLS